MSEKWSRRHPALAGAGSMVLAFLIAGIVVPPVLWLLGLWWRWWGWQ